MATTTMLKKPPLKSRNSTFFPILIIGCLFAIFGFVSWLNSILIPYLRIACELTGFESYLVTFAFYISYLLFSLPSGYLLRKTGFKRGIVIGLCIMAAGIFLFIPAGYFRTYPFFLSGLFTIGMALSLLQTAANPYITILGEPERASQRISIMGICNKTAGLISPLIFASVILRKSDDVLIKQLPSLSIAEKTVALNELSQRVMLPYFIAGLLLIGFALMVKYSRLPEINADEEKSDGQFAGEHRNSIFHFPHLVLGAIAIFFHVGTQVISIDTVVNYATSMGVPLLKAKFFPSCTLFFTIVGYLGGIIIVPKFISQTKGLKGCVLLGMILSVLSVFYTHEVSWFGYHTDISIWFVVMLGLPNSFIWAGIWAVALRELGKFTKVGASLLVMGLCGNAILPLIYGYFSDHVGPKEAYWVLIPCYAYLLFYAFAGYKIRRWKKPSFN